MSLKIKKGTIIRNDFVSDDHPLKYSLVYAITQTSVHTLYIKGGKIHKASYNKFHIGKGLELVKGTEYFKTCTNILNNLIEQARSTDYASE